MLEIQWAQHAVGHGGFHTGHLRGAGGGRFHWAFDCGAKRTAKFETYLKDWTRRTSLELDWLFVSHFDMDHVSGLDTLMSRTIVKNVMVPYLNEHEFSYLLLHEIARGNLQRTLFELVADPTNFFVSRGAERVIFLRGGSPKSETIRPDTEGPDKQKGDRGWFTVINPQPTPFSPSQAVAHPFRPVSHAEIIDGGSCEILFHTQEMGVRLKPYRAPVDADALTGILDAIENLINEGLTGPRRPGLGPLAYAVARHARTAAGRKELQGVYSQFAGSSNRASLSLLSIPIAGTNMQRRWSLFGSPFGNNAWGSDAAWLNTGDAELLDPIDLDDWINCYRHDLDKVRVLALPHHGSDKNSDATFQSLCPTAKLTAQVRAGSKKHPGDVVISCAGSRLAPVTNDLGSAIQMIYHAY